MTLVPFLNSIEWRRTHQQDVAVEIRKELKERPSKTRKFRFRNLLSCFGYVGRSPRYARSISHLLKSNQILSSPSLLQNGKLLRDADWVTLTLTTLAETLEEDENGFIEEVVTAGSMPYPKTTFDSLLAKNGIRISAFGSDCEILVIGRAGWEEEQLDFHIESRRGRELRVYSQEMFIAGLWTGEDPYDDPAVLLNFGRGHPAFEFLSEWGFDWPTTTIVPGKGGEVGDPSLWPRTGMLQYLGYRVGVNGLDSDQRRKILGEAFTSPLPNVESPQYMKEWCSPRSAGRLLKLANTLASFARNAKRRAAEMSAAISDWEQDLAWLKDEFYHGRFTFPWPSTGPNS